MSIAEVAPSEFKPEALDDIAALKITANNNPKRPCFLDVLASLATEIIPIPRNFRLLEYKISFNKIDVRFDYPSEFIQHG